MKKLKRILALVTTAAMLAASSAIPVFAAEEPESAPEETVVELLDAEEDTVTLTADPVAQIGENTYTSVYAACTAATEGCTIELLSDCSGSGTITGVDNVTLDLGGYTLTGGITVKNGAELTVTNGTVNRTTENFGAINVYPSGDSDNKTKVTISDTATVKAVTYGIIVWQINSTDGTGVYVEVNGSVSANAGIFVLGNIYTSNTSDQIVINGSVTSTDEDGSEEGLAIALNGAENLVINDGAYVAGPTGIEVRAGSLTVNGGTIVATGNPASVSGNASGTTTVGYAIAVSQHTTKLPISVTIYGGTITATAAAALGEVNPQNNAADALDDIAVTVYGGEFTTESDEVDAVSLTDYGTISTTIVGGTYSDDSVTTYIGEDSVALAVSDGEYTVVTNTADYSNIASTINVEFEQIDDSDIYYINLVGDSYSIIYRFLAAQLKFALEEGTDASVGYTIAAADGISLTQNGDVYEFNLSDITADGGNYALTGNSVTIGTVTFVGVGEFTFGVDADNVQTTLSNKVQTALYGSTDNNIVRTYLASGDTGYDSGSTLGVSNTITDTLSLDEATLTINVVFPNSVDEQIAAYNDMQINLSNVLGDSTIYLGNNVTETDYTVAYGKAEIDDTEYTAYVVTTTVPKAYATAFEFVGAGYRTYRTSITPTDDATVTVWNNAMDSEDTVVISADENAMGDVTTNVTFLAGDIVANNVIDLWDLSAVVSYFGKAATDEELTAAWDYTMYDLNRDGKIDSRDIAMVLVSWDY